MFKGWQLNLILFLLTVCTQLTSVSQSYWLRRAGGLSGDEAKDLASDGAGNYYSCGYFTSFAAFGIVGLYSNGLSDGYVYQFDEDGVVQWVLNFGGPFVDRATACTVANDGNIYVTGEFQGTAEFGPTTLTAVDSTDIFVVAISSDGNFNWARSFGGNFSDYANDISTDNAGNVVVTGNFGGEATFGTIVLESTPDPETLLPTKDVYIMKLDNTGECLWVKQGVGINDEMGNGICCDNNNHIYACGNFENEITFDAVIGSLYDSSGYLLSCNEDGGELWSASIHSDGSSANSVLFNEGNIYFSGNFISELHYETNGSNGLIPFQYEFNLFLWKISPSGTTQWIKSDGSDSDVNCVAMAGDTDGTIYLAGEFNCTFKEYSEATSPWLYMSAGYRDLFVVQYASSGERNWMRQFAGPRNDFLGGITPSTTINSPVIAGSFEKFHSIPSNPDFIVHNDIINPVAFNASAPNTVPDNCYDEFYDNFQSIFSSGGRDVFYSRPLHPNKGTYDFHSHEGNGCSNASPTPCVVECNQYYCDAECLTELSACDGTFVGRRLYTGSDEFIGPGYEIEWNTGEQTPVIFVGESDEYYYVATTYDGCYSYAAGIDVTVNPVEVPLITDDAGFNFEQTNPSNAVIVCEDFEILLSATSPDSSGTWWNDGEAVFQADSILVNHSGYFQLHYINEFNCMGFNQVQVIINEILPGMSFTLVGSDEDTITMCLNEVLPVAIFPEPEDSLWVFQTGADWEYYFENELYDYYQGEESGFIVPTESGNYTAVCTPFTYSFAPCPTDTIYYAELSYSIYIEVLPSPQLDPQLVASLYELCPGDTILLTVSDAPNLTWQGDNYAGFPDSTSAYVTQPGLYTITVEETFENGCDDYEIEGVIIWPVPDPLVVSSAPFGVLCPGDSIILTCNEGSAYQWYGNTGGLLGEEQELLVHEPGSYYCIQTNFDGCTLASNVVDVLDYLPPIILSYPFNDLCFYGETNILIVPANQSEIEWLPPLSGTSPQQTVDEPGVYSANVVVCNITSLLQVEITDTPTYAGLLEFDSTWCPGDSIILVAPAGASQYLWFPSFTEEQTLIVAEPGEYWVQLTNSIGCLSVTPPINVEEVFLQAPVVITNEICPGDEATLNASSDAPVFWSSDELGATLIGEGFTFISNPIFSDTVFYVHAAEGNCISPIAPVQVEVSPNYYFGTSGDTTLCEGTDLQLSANVESGFEASWLLPDNAQVNGNNLSIMNATAANSGWYVVYIPVWECEFSDSIYVEVEANHLDELISVDPLLLCIGETLVVTPLPGYESYVWQTPQGNVEEEILEINPVEMSDNGIYTLSVPGEICDVVSDEIEVTINDYPYFELTEDIVWCEFGFPIVHVPVDSDVILWSTGSSENSIVLPDDGFVILALMNLPHCEVVDTLQMIYPECEVIIPNIFTPNNDGSNDFIDFGLMQFTLHHVAIFNRWGTMVYELNSFPWTWYGNNSNGDELADGTYYYIIEFGNVHEEHKRDGYIHLVR